MLESKKLVPKKNHHFVWRRYLENWQVDNKLAYFATKKHIAATETALGVAKQDFFINWNILKIMKIYMK